MSLRRIRQSFVWKPGRRAVRFRTFSTMLCCYLVTTTEYSSPFSVLPNELEEEEGESSILFHSTFKIRPTVSDNQQNVILLLTLLTVPITVSKRYF